MFDVVDPVALVHCPLTRAEGPFTMAPILGPVALILGSISPRASTDSVAFVVHNAALVHARVSLGHGGEALDVDAVAGACQVVVRAVGVVRIQHNRRREYCKLVHQVCVGGRWLYVLRFVLKIELRLVGLHSRNIRRQNLWDHSDFLDVWVHFTWHSDHGHTFFVGAEFDVLDGPSYRHCLACGLLIRYHIEILIL